MSVTSFKVLFHWSSVSVWALLGYECGPSRYYTRELKWFCQAAEMANERVLTHLAHCLSDLCLSLRRQAECKAAAAGTVHQTDQINPRV